MNMSAGGQAAAAGLARTPRASGWRRWLSPGKLWANRMGIIGGGIFLLFLLCGIFAPWLARSDPNEVNLLDRFRYPTFCNALPWVQTYEPEEGQIIGAVFCHPDLEERKGFLGTDKLGRDLLSRLIHGARIAMIVALSASALSGVIGISIGIATAYYGGLVDDVIMRIADTWDSVPPMVIMLALLAFIPGGVVTLIILLGVVGGGWIGTVRIVRGESLSLRRRDYVLAAQALGASDKRVMFRHILPNTMAPIIVGKTMGIGGVILAESGLSFLGLGVPADVPSWGRMLTEGQEFILVAWWPSIFPGLIITVVVLSTVFLGDWLRDTLDPRLRGSR